MDVKATLTVKHSFADGGLTRPPRKYTRALCPTIFFVHLFCRIYPFLFLRACADDAPNQMRRHAHALSSTSIIWRQNWKQLTRSDCSGCSVYLATPARSVGGALLL